MTTEEKAKAYDEAIEKINRCSTDKYGCVIGIKPSDIFPQFSESEDERIRKELLELIKHCYEDGGYALCTDDYKKFSNYLEKQKEQKPSEIDEYEIIKKHITEDVLSGEVNTRLKECGWYVTDEKPAEWSEEEALDETKQECDSIDIPSSIKTSRKETLKNIISYFKYERKTTQEEIHISFIPCLENLLKDVENTNSPAEWSEEDEANWQNYIKQLELQYSKGPNVVLWDDINWLKYVHDKFKSLPERFNLQPKQEWSEEDYNVILIAIDWLEYYRDTFATTEQTKDEITTCVERLESLRPQSHWKPSEQEKGALRTAIYILTEERNFPKAAAQLQSILNAFEGKESRKDWKPSEEQMIALKKAICYLAEYGSRSDDDLVLDTLYDEL